MDNAEASLGSALVAMVAGSRPQVSTTDVEQLLRRFFQVENFRVYKFKTCDFLIRFEEREDASRVLHTASPNNAPFKLIFRRWGRQIGASSAPMLFKVQLAIENIPAHAWSLEVAQEIVGSSCLAIQP